MFIYHIVTNKGEPCSALPCLVAYGRYVVPTLLLLLVDMLFVAAHELVNASGGVNQLHLTGIERMRGVRDFHFYQGILLTIYVDGFLGIHGRFGDKNMLIRHVLECHQSIIFGVNSLLHCEC